MSMLEEPRTWYTQAVDILRDPRAAADRGSLARARGLLLRADAAIDEGDELRPDVYNALAGTYEREFELTREPAVLHDAVEYARRAVLLADGTDTDVFARSTLAHILTVRFTWTRNVADVKEAADVLRPVEQVTGIPDRERAALLVTLGITLQTLFAETSENADIDRARSVLLEAVRLTRGDLVAGRFQTTLGNTLCIRYEAYGDVDDLHAAVGHCRDAVEHARRPEFAEHIPPAESARYLANLGQALALRFDRLAGLGDLEDAIAAFREAGTRTPDPSDAAQMLGNLALALVMRHRHLGSLEDLDQAVACARFSAAYGPSGDLSEARRLNTLASALLLRHGHTGRSLDIDTAVDVQVDALRATNASAPERLRWLNDLGVALVTRYEAWRNPADLDSAIRVLRDCLGPADRSPLRAGRLSNLSKALTHRAELTGSQADARGAVRAARLAVAADRSEPGASDPSPAAARHLHNLGIALAARGVVTGDEEDDDEAASVLDQVAGIRTASFQLRALSSRLVGRLVGERDWRVTADALERATGLLASVANRRISRASRQAHLARFDGMASDGAAAALNLGEAERALGILEQGRGVLLAQTLETRGEVDALREHDAALADEFERLSALLDADTAGATTYPTGADHPEAETSLALRSGWADQWEALLERVRTTVPGHARFLLPPHVEELTPAADGPLVLVNVSQYRCDALVLTERGVEVVPLPLLNPATVSEYVRALAEETAPGRDPEDFLTGMLEWLWRTVAKPVLDRVALHLGERRRLWWLPTGPLSLLPLHAAGLRAGEDGRFPASVHDTVVSSYAPTVRSLLHHRHRHRHRRSPSAGGALVVTMDRGEGTRGVSLAREERASVEWILGAGTTALTNERATARRVLAALPQFGQAHLACHGLTDLKDPSNSCLLLHDGPLKVRDIVALDLPAARLAFLSACSTASPGPSLTNEAIHVSSSFHLAGYPHVIGTLWPVADGPCLEVTEGVYTAAGDLPPAEALHRAVAALRAVYVDSPSVWAAHIHIGV
ncbi:MULTISPECIES: CHAT domain-containing protein [Streptomyces]|uniref:CHAT domain-containing protein n=1 Tax=Streptomyces TaxID=1883 RepID=UPI00240E31F8|nr:MULTISPECIES: CHAT domain-containing protein [Streptomyces]WFB83603.1 CHAT domain-containing protein [Streptomyces olivaceus]WGK45906.1 CHAT domain-containing protein [Streptomyces sp. B146]